jgi:hypothetical protein
MNVGQSRGDNSAYFLLWIACAGSSTSGVSAVLPGSRKNFSGGFVDFLLGRGRRPQCRWISGRDAVRAPRLTELKPHS